MTLFLSELSSQDTTTFDDSYNSSIWAEQKQWLSKAKPVRPLLSQDFYPLSGWSIDEDGWLAYSWCAYDSQEAGQADISTLACAVQAFRRWGSAMASSNFRLCGLHPEATYRISDWLAEQSDDDGQVRSGASLMEEGLDILIEGTPGASMLLLTLESPAP